MSVGRPNHAELVWIGAELLLEHQTLLQCLSSVLAGQHLRLLEFRDIEISNVPGSIVRELIIGRQSRVCFTIALDLGDFVKRLPFCPQRYVFLVDPATGVGFVDREHPAVRQIAIVCECECPPAGLFFVVLEPLIKVQGIGTAKRGLRHHRHNLLGAITIVAQDHISVQVETFGDRGPLEADKGREAARLVIGFGSRDNLVPYVVINCRARAVLFKQFDGNRSLREIANKVERSFSRCLTTFCEAFSPFLTFRNGQDIRRPTLNVRCDTHHVGMIGDYEEVEWAAELDGLAASRHHLLTARQSVCRVVPGRVAEQPGIERETRVQMGFTPVDTTREGALGPRRIRFARIQAVKVFRLRGSSVMLRRSYRRSHAGAD